MGEGQQLAVTQDVLPNLENLNFVPQSHNDKNVKGKGWFKRDPIGNFYHKPHKATPSIRSQGLLTGEWRTHLKKKSPECN